MVGEDLRVVRTVATDEDGAESAHLHIREDIDETYTEEEKDRITEEVIYHTLGEGYRSGLFRLGEPNYTVYAFDEAFVVLFYEDETHGTVVSIDSDFEGAYAGWRTSAWRYSTDKAKYKPWSDVAGYAGP